MAVKHVCKPFLFNIMFNIQTLVWCFLSLCLLACITMLAISTAQPFWEYDKKIMRDMEGNLYILTRYEGVSDTYKVEKINKVSYDSSLYYSSEQR